MEKSGPPKYSILLVTTELRPGGAEKCLVNLACGLDRDRFSPSVVSIADPPSPQQDVLVQKLKEREIPVNFLKINSKSQVFSAVARLRRVIQSTKPDLVQSFLVHANILTGLALGRFPKIPFFTGIRVADPSPCRHRIERWATSRATGIICVSQQVADFAKQVMKLPPEKLSVIPNGLEVVETRETKQSADPPRVLYVGRLEKQKGLVEFLKKLHDFQSSLPPFELTFVGEGSLRSELERLAESLDRRVEFLGWHPNPREIMKNSAVLILPSLWEGLPNVLLEAMAEGTPVTVFEVDGVKDIKNIDAQNPDFELQFRVPGDYRSFFQSLTQLLTDKSLAARIGNTNRALIQQHYGLEKMIANYELAYLKPLNHLE